MSIASRITSIEGHITNDYQALSDIGADLTGVDKNIENIANVLADVYNEMPKVSGTGSNITLDGTRPGKMVLDYNGDTQQDSTTGKNLLRNDLTSQTINDLTITVYDDKTIKINGTASANTWLNINENFAFESGKTYILSGCAGNGSLATYYMYVNGQSMQDIGSGATKTFSEDVTTGIIIKINKNAVLNNLIFKPMLRLSNTTDEYEPYTNGPSPNPDYPQPIHNVSGDNTIEICGKNLFDKSNIIEGKYIDGSGNFVNDSSNFIGALTKIDNTKQYYVNSSSVQPKRIAYYDSSQAFISRQLISAEGGSLTIPNNAIYLRLSCYNVDLDSLQLEQNNQASTYEPYTGNSQLISLGVENLWKNQSTGFLPQSGSYPTTNSSAPNARYILVNLLEGQSITLSGSTSTQGRVRYIDKDTNQVVGTILQETNEYYISTGSFGAFFNEGTITAKKQFIVGIMDMSGSVNNLVVNYGKSAQHISTTPIELCRIGDYQDYIYKDNDRWFLHKEIGKYIFDGSVEFNYTNGVFYKNNILSYTKNQDMYCDYYTYGGSATNTTTAYANGNNTISSNSNDGASIYFRNDSITSKNDFTTWLTTNKPVLYYVLATPTDTEITDTTLLEQLEAIKRSYDGVTNISQENNDLPFILDVSALKEWNNE